MLPTLLNQTKGGNMTDTKPISIRGIDEGLWTQFKILCLKEGKTIPEKLTELIKEAL